MRAESQMQRRLRGATVAFTAGALSASFSTLMFQPLDLVKTRMQVHSLPIRVGVAPLCVTANGGTVGMLGTFSTVVRAENFTALWKGISPSMHRCVPSIGVYFASVHSLKSTIGKTDGTVSPLQALCIGASARSFAASSFLPFTVVKTRFESGYFQYKTVIQGLRSIWTTEGFKGLFSGLWATLGRDAPFSALYLLFYTQSKQAILRITHEEQLPSSYNFPCGVAAGVLASVATQPADVVKTRMQLQPQAYPSVINTIAVVVRNNGLRGLLVGLAPRATRRTLMAAFTWAFYEEIVRVIDRGLESY